MKTMIRSFASALVAVMTLGLVQTAQAEPCSIEQLVEPEGACTITQDKTQAEGGEEVKFTLSNIKEGYQVEDVKVFLYGEGGEIYPDYNYEEDYYSFNMPEENVYIYVRCEKPTTEYSIDIPTFSGGSVTSDVPSAQEGAPVTLTVTPDKGYELASIVVVGDGVTIDPKKGEGSTYTFTMPPSAVEVQATFKAAATKYNIAISKSIEHGTVTSNVAATNEGATVTLTVTPDAGCKLASILVEGDLATIVPEGEGSTYTFTMPACAVTVSATFKEQRAPYDGVIAIPGTLQAENYDKGGEGVAYHDTDKYNEGGVYREDDVDIEAANGGYAVAWTADEEWLEYTVNVAETGEYDISAYLAHLDSSPSITLSVDGTNVVTLTATEPTHSWIQYAEVVGKATLTAGDHIVRIANIVGNIDWVKFTKAATKYTIGWEVQDDGCVVNPSATEEVAGNPVAFTLSDFAEGFNVGSMFVNDPDLTHEPIEPTWDDSVQAYTFTMPDYDVIIFVYRADTPATAHTITTVADPENTCEFEVYPVEMEAPEGDWVDFRFNLADGANFVSLTVYNTDDPTQTIGEEYIYTYVDENGDEWHYFEMPDYNVTIKVTTESGGTPSATAHDISTVADPADTCEFTLSKTWAWPNDTVDFRFNLADGANLVSLDVYNTDDPSQTIGKDYIGTYVDANGDEWHYFTMPDYNVTIKVTTESGGTPDPGSGHKISTEVTPSEACEVHAPDGAAANEPVYFELGNFASGATLESLTAWNMSAGEQVKVEPYEKGYIFTMPDGDVLIEVVCSAEPPKDPEILNVTAQQRYPWNGLVDIGYTVTGTVPDGYVLKVSATDMKTYDTFEAKTITAEAFPLTEGTHTLKWDMNADGYTTTVSDRVRFRVEAVSSAGGVGTMSGQTKVDLRTGTTREIALGATETLTFSTDYEGGPTPPKQEGVQLWENGPYFATTNIGAATPQDYGYYFWWGDTVGYVHDDVMNTWTSVDGKGTTISFDADNCPTYGMDIQALRDSKWIDDNNNLVPAHDAATMHWGGKWRMPTSAELQALVANTETSWTNNWNGTGVSGRIVTGKGTFSGNSIFLPAAGDGYGSDLRSPGGDGGYWSSTPFPYNPDISSSLYIDSNYFDQVDDDRFGGFSIRPVQSAAANAAANGASNEGETVTITVNGKTLKSGLSPSGTVDWTPTEPGEYVLNHIVNSADGSTEITNLVAYYNVQAPTLVQVVPAITGEGLLLSGVYTNGAKVARDEDNRYMVASNATVDVVFYAVAELGYFYKNDTGYSSYVTNTVTAVNPENIVIGPTPVQGTPVGASAYAFVDGDTCTIVGSGTADTRLSTVVSPGAITSVVIQPGITEVGARFFKDFKWLNAVTGGQDLKTVGTNAFYKCFSLETIDLDCTAVPTGLDSAVVYQNALKPDGTIYQIPNIKVKNYVAMLYGKENVDDAEWKLLGPAEDANIYKQGIYHFFYTRLEPEK